MKERLRKAVTETTEVRALFVLGIVLSLRAWRKVPTLRPNQLAIPATFSIISTLIIAAQTPVKFLFIYSLGLFITLAVFMFPMLRKPPRQTAHWVKGNE